MEENLALPSQLSYAKWATKQDPHTALALICYYGWARSTVKQNVEEFCIYKMTLTDDGVIIDIEYHHTFQERLDAACQAALQEKLNNDRLTRKNDFATIQQIAISKFFFFKNRYVSASPAFNTMIKATIQQYIIKLLDARSGEGYDIPFPKIDEPTNIMKDDTIVLTWNKFTFTSSTNAQVERNRDINKQRCLESFQKRFNDYPQNTPITYADLGRPHQELMKRGKKFGFISSEKRGIYVLHYPREGGYE